MKNRIRSRARSRNLALPGAAMIAGLTLMALLILVATAARAQTLYPRVGMSASPTEYIDTLEVVPGEEFTLYACVFGPGPGEPVDQAFTSLSWVIHQVCCGAEVDIYHVELNPDFDHTGHPLVGVISSSESCIDQDSIVLATMKCRLTNPTPGGVLWAAGPYDASHDCVGGNALFMGMAVTLMAEDDSVPTEEARWGSIKALYR
jgi:hypothetical protein